MIPAKHTRFHTGLMSRYTRRGLKKTFSRVVVHGGFVENGNAILVVANHFSWWDGFFIYYLNDHFFHRKFHVMMLEDQLRRNRILRKAGAFSIRKNSRSVIDSLSYARKILEEGPQNLLLFYPQGEISSLYTQPLTFQRGLEKVVNRLEPKVSIWMVAGLIDYFSRKKPELHLYLEQYDPGGMLRMSDLESEYNHFLLTSKQSQSP